MIMQPTKCRSSTTGQRPSLAMTRATPSSRSSRPSRQNSGSSRRRRNFRSISCGTITISTACSNAPRCRRSSARPTITRKKLINVALVAVCLVFPFALTGDYAYAEWGNKPVAFVGCGGLGGARAVEQLRLHAVELQMVPIRSAIHILFPDWPTPPSASDTPGAQVSHSVLFGDVADRQADAPARGLLQIPDFRARERRTENDVLYRGKPAVRNDRGDRGNVGIIRSPVRASILPDCGARGVILVPTATIGQRKNFRHENGR